MRIVCLIIGVLMMVGTVAAQEMQAVDIKKVESESSVGVLWLITTVFVIATLVVAFKPAKRAKLE